MAPNDFGGKVALVTGGGGSIGRATCLQLARDGARVLVTDANVEAARNTVSLLPGDGAHLALEMDVTQQSSVERVIAAAKEKFGAPPSLLVNSAGIFHRAPFVDVTSDSRDALIDVNVKGTFIVSQVFTKALLDAGQEAGEGRGAMVNISSITGGKLPYVGAAPYTATKGAVISLTKTCAAELASKGIRVNCVLPGIIATPMSQPHIQQSTGLICIDNCPLGRPGKPEEVAEVIVFLLSERSSYMVGACVDVTGGLGM